MRREIALLGLVFAFAMPAAAQDRLEEEFTPPELNWGSWCPCLVNMTKAPIAFLPDADQSGDYFAQIVVDENSLGGNVCRRGAPHYECRKPQLTIADEPPADEPPERDEYIIEPLGPSFMDAINPAAVLPIIRKNDYCTPDVMKRVEAAGEENECIQRQEIQFQKPLLHELEKPYLYSFRFRMPGPVEDKEHSIRWVIAQWKQEQVSDAYGKELGPKWGPSPFLAQRFDDGVLHVTVLDEHCRCTVASAPLADSSIISWKDGPAQYCQSIKPGASEGKACTADLKVEYGDNPVLSSPVDNWVEMRYRVQAGREHPSVIEVYEGDRFIVRVTGKIGYEPKPDEPVLTRFKIGQYRDYMPTVDAMDIDWIEREALPN